MAVDRTMFGYRLMADCCWHGLFIFFYIFTSCNNRYKPEIVMELQNDTVEQMEQNVASAVKFVQGSA